MKSFLGLLSLCLALSLSQPAAAGPETQSGPNDRSQLGVTVYNNGLAFVRDSRKVTLPAGESRLAFGDIAARIKPASAVLHSTGVRVVEQNFDFDLLSPASLLAKHVGREVGLVENHPTSGQERVVKGTLLAVSGGKALIRTGKRIEVVDTRSPYRVIFYDVPPNLRERPTLSMLLQNGQAGPKELKLSYLTEGISWRADYLGILSPDQKHLELKAWITLTNQSGAAYPNATLQLVAGQVHQAAPAVRGRRETPSPMLMKQAALPAREKLFEYHLYTVPRPVTIADRQTKQVELLSAPKVPVGAEYLVSDALWPRAAAAISPWRDLPVAVYLALKNDKPALGLPLPQGVARLFKRDSRGVLQFIGEDRINHTPEGREVSLRLGNAFDLTARKRQTHFERLGNREREIGEEISLHNASAAAVTIKVVERFHGELKVVQESQEHLREAAGRLAWLVKAPAKGKALLSYRVRLK